jgi:hypothetical protein
MDKHNGTSIIDWRYYEKRARQLTDDQLRYVIQDCREAMVAAPAEANFPCKAEGFYADEVHVYSGELRRRRDKGVSRG